MKAKYLRGTIWQLVRIEDRASVQHIVFKALAGRGELTVVLHTCGHVELMRRGQIMSMKSDRRQRIKDIAYQAMAYVTLTEGTAGFPAVRLL